MLWVAPVVMVATGGYRVEQILLQRDLRRPAVPYLRVTRLGYWIDDCRTVAEGATLRGPGRTRRQ